jgi:cytochrome c oxidase cbb3-type subunit 2
MIANARNDALGQSLPDSEAASGLVERYGEATTVRSFDDRPDMLSEMDAVVAYLQILGRLTDIAQRAETMPEE